MKFLDANVFIYAYYKPSKQLTRKETFMKNEAKEIIDKINAGKEEVLTTIVHVSEVVNILKHGMPLNELIDVVLGLFMLDNVKMLGISQEEYFSATELGRDLELDPNDALAVQTMRLNKLKEIYSFDEEFDKIEDIVRLPRI